MADLDATNAAYMSNSVNYDYGGDAYSVNFSAFDQRNNQNQKPKSKFLPENERKPAKNGVLGETPMTFRDGTEKINKLLKNGNSTLHGLQTKFADGQTMAFPSGYSNFNNEALTDEELQLQEYTTQEKELLETLNVTPVGSFLYRSTLNKIKELATLKHELEKIIREQKLSGDDTKNKGVNDCFINVLTNE